MKIAAKLDWLCGRSHFQNSIHPYHPYHIPEIQVSKNLFNFRFKKKKIYLQMHLPTHRSEQLHILILVQHKSHVPMSPDVVSVLSHRICQNILICRKGHLLASAIFWKCERTFDQAFWQPVEGNQRRLFSARTQLRLIHGYNHLGR